MSYPARAEGLVNSIVSVIFYGYISDFRRFPSKFLICSFLSWNLCRQLLIFALKVFSFSFTSFTVFHANNDCLSSTECWRCPWCSRYRHRKWTRRHEFKSWTRLIAFHIALIPLGKVWIQLLSLQLWVNSRTDEVLQPWLGN